MIKLVMAGSSVSRGTIPVQGNTATLKVKEALEKSLELLGPLKEDVILTLGLKYGITFSDDYAPIKEIEDLLFFLFETGAEPIVQNFRNNLDKMQSKNGRL